MSKQVLLESKLLSRLEGYRLVRQRPVALGDAGTRRSTAKGGTVEFADYREYTPGDEPRRVDWKAYARLGRLYVKEYQDERQDQTLILIDTSASMDWGAGEEHKGLCALRLAAGLGTCALAGNDRLSAVAGAAPWAAGAAGTGNDEPGGSAPQDNAAGGLLAADGGDWVGGLAAEKHFRAGAYSPIRVCPPMAARRLLPRLWNWLGEIPFGGVTDLPGCLRVGLNTMPGAASLYVVSDLLDTDGVEEMLHLAAGRGMAATLLHILAPGELEPPGEGEWTLMDAETGARVDVSLTPGVLRDYANRLHQLYSTLDQSCRRWGARRLLINTGRSPAEILLYTLPGFGILKK